MAQLEEITSEDLGFKLASEGEGWSLFDEAVDLEKFDNATLNLLAIGNKNKLIAASNGQQLVLGKQEEMESLKKLDAPGITQVFFNYDESKLLLNREGDLFEIVVDSYLQGDDSMTKFDSDVTSCMPSRINDDLLVFKNGNIHVGDKIIEKVVVYTWAHDQFCYITHNEQDKIQFSQGKSIPIQSDILDRDFHPQDLIYLAKEKFFIAYESNESDLQDHEIESFINNNGEMIQADLAPPFGYMGRTATYYSTLLCNWIPSKQFALITSSCSSDINMLSLSPLESIGQSEDTNRAQFPLEDGDDTTPIGFALDLQQLTTTVKQPVQGVEEATGKLPLLYALLNTGKLISWWIFDKTELINDNVDLKGALDEDIQFKNGANKTKLDSEQVAETKETANPFGNSDPFAKTSQKSESTPFGQSSFGSATSSGAFGVKATESKPFGSSGAKVSNDSPFATKAPEALGAFGKTGFGATATEAPSTFGNTGFGATAASAPLSFTQPSSGSGFGQTSFGQQKQTGGSVFGSLGFGSLGTSTTTSGFAKMATSSGGFGSLAAKTSDSPFAKLNTDTKSSPFDIFNNESKSEDIFSNKGTSSFGQPSETKKKLSPFDSFDTKKDSLEELGDSQGSSFVDLGDLDESLNSSTQEVEKKNDLSSSFGAFGKSATKPTDSPFGSFDKPTQTLGSNSDKPLASTTESPFAKFGAKPLTSNTESPFAKFGGPSTLQSLSGFGKPSTPVELKSTDTNKASPFDSLKKEGTENKASPSLKVKESTETDLLKGPPLSKSPLFSINANKSMESLLAPSLTSSRQGSPVPDTPKPKGPVNKFEKQNRPTPYVDILDSEADSFPPSSVAQLEQESSDEESLKTKEEDEEEDEEIDEIEFLEKRQPITEEKFLSYDGPTQVKDQHANKIGQQIINIINQTSGQLTIVERNLEILGKKLEYQDGATTELTFDALEIEDKWILADEFSELIASTQVDLNNHIDEIVSLPGKLEGIIGKIEKNQTTRMRIDQLFAQLTEFTSENTNRKLQNRKLDLPNSILRTTLRTKLANITQQEEELRKNLMSLKAKRSSSTEMISNLESVILQLNGNIRHHLDNVNDLSLQIENLSINKKSPQLIESNHSMVPGVKSRWELAKKRSQTKIVPNKVQFT